MDFKINPQDSAFMVELKMEAARNESWDREFIKDMNLAMYQKQNLKDFVKRRNRKIPVPPQGLTRDGDPMFTL